MGKKTQGGVVVATIPDPITTATGDGDVKSKIHDYAVFFDKLVELIPAKFYLPSDDPKPWFQGLSKIAKASAKAETRKNIKLARRQRLDPENSNVTTLDILKQSIISKKEKEDDEDDDDDDDDNEDDDDDDEEEEQIEIKPIKDLSDADTDTGGVQNQSRRSATYEELQQRLHSKLEELRANRGQGKRSNFERERPFKRKREFETQGEDMMNSQKSELDVEEAAKGIEFGKVKIEDGNKKKKMKGSKAMELEKAMKLAESNKDPEVSKKHSWKSAASRAAGMKVHDDPKILKHSIKKEQKKREKNADKWKERIETVEKMKGEKQKKRAGNIAERKNDKKARKIAKREKKLMRPGFEGRKQGYIS